MEDLTKQQLVLLTLLVSFVTSLATGIITFSLMDQAPINITQTIDRVVEHTIEHVTSPLESPAQPAAAVVVDQPPSTSEIVDRVSKGIVKIKPRGIGADGITGLGIVLTSQGLIVTDKSLLGISGSSDIIPDFVAVTSSGEEYPIRVIEPQILGDAVFLAMKLPEGKNLVPVTWASTSTSIKLGDAAYVLSGKTTSILESGIIQKLGGPNEPLETSISSRSIDIGSPLFTKDGLVIGFKTFSLKDTQSFYQIGSLRTLASQIPK